MKVSIELPRSVGEIKLGPYAEADHSDTPNSFRKHGSTYHSFMNRTLGEKIYRYGLNWWLDSTLNLLTMIGFWLTYSKIAKRKK